MSRYHTELEQLKFSPAQKEAMIGRLTAGSPRERKISWHFPYRRLVALAATLSLFVGAAAGVSLVRVSPEFRALFGITTQADEEKLNAVALDETFYDRNGSGASLTVREVVRDQERIFVLADFAAPEGTVLPTPETAGSDRGYWFEGNEERSLVWNLYQDEACTQRASWRYGLGYSCTALADSDPGDNVIPLLIYVEAGRGLPDDASYLRLRNLFRLCTAQGLDSVPVVDGLDLEAVIPITTSTPVYAFSGRCPVKLGNAAMAVVENLVLSPLSISMDLIVADSDSYDRALAELGGWPAYVLLKDGSQIALQFHESAGILDHFYTQDGELGERGALFFRSDHVYFTPERPIDLDQIQDIVFVGDNDPGKVSSNEIVHFLFQSSNFYHESYWDSRES